MATFFGTRNNRVDHLLGWLRAVPDKTKFRIVMNVCHHQLAICSVMANKDVIHAWDAHDEVTRSVFAGEPKLSVSHLHEILDQIMPAKTPEPPKSLLFGNRHGGEAFPFLITG